MSVIKSLEHASMHCKLRLNLIWVDASHLEEATKHTNPEIFNNTWHQVRAAQGILVPGGFGYRLVDPVCNEFKRRLIG